MTTDELYKELKQNGYTFLGCQNAWKRTKAIKGNLVVAVFSKKDHPKYCKCIDEHHKLRVFKNIKENQHIIICDICKIYYMYYSSD